MNSKDIEATTEVPMHLLPAITSIEGALACRQDAIENGPYNWRTEPVSLMATLGNMERYIARLKDGEWVDSTSGVKHLGILIATAGMLLDAVEVGTAIDDRPKPRGNAGPRLKQLSELMRTDVAADSITQELLEAEVAKEMGDE